MAYFYNDDKRVSGTKDNKVKKYIKENPGKSAIIGIGIGAIIGAVIAKLLRRKK